MLLVPKLKVRFFATENGKEPVKEWLKELTKIERKTIGDDIKTVQFGWPLGMPLVKNIGQGLWEVRSTIPNGIARVLFVAKAGEMILLHGIIKKTNKLPPQEKELALKRLKLWESQNEKK